MNKQEYKKPEITELSAASGTAAMAQNKTDAGAENGATMTSPS